MRNFRNRFFQFMSGRYGMDEYSKFLFCFYFIGVIVLWIVEFFVQSIVTLIISMALTALAFYMLFRTMSRSIAKRRNENMCFLKVRSGFRGWFRLQKDRLRDRKTHIFRKCPSCKAVLRLKRIKGAHRAACPRCGKSFDIVVR